MYNLTVPTLQYDRYVSRIFNVSCNHGKAKMRTLLNSHQHTWSQPSFWQAKEHGLSYTLLHRNIIKLDTTYLLRTTHERIFAGSYRSIYIIPTLKRRSGIENEPPGEDINRKIRELIWVSISKPLQEPSTPGPDRSWMIMQLSPLVRRYNTRYF